MVVTAFIIVIDGGSSNSRSIYSHMSFSFQLPERAIFQIKQYNSVSCGVSEWQLEEAQVFWAKKEQSLALSILKQMIKKLDASCAAVCFFIGWISVLLLFKKHKCALFKIVLITILLEP